VRLDFIIKWCTQHIIDLNKCKIWNKKSTENKFRREILIGVNSYSFANCLAMEVINTKTSKEVDKKYKTTATAFQALKEYEFIPLSKYEPTERRSRFKFYEALQLKQHGAHFGRPLILTVRENESDLRYIRYAISIPHDINMTDTAVLKKLESIQNTIAEDIISNTLTHMKNDIEDVLTSQQEGKGVAYLTNKLQNIDQDLATTILSHGVVSSSIIMDICAVAEKRSSFELFFKLCNDQCMKRVSGALAKRHGSVEEVDHVTSVAEVWRLGSKQIEEYNTDEDGVIDADEVAKNVPSYDYLSKQLSPKNEYAVKSGRYYSLLKFRYRGGQIM
jgi:hypothetical protein